MLGRRERPSLLSGSCIRCQGWMWHQLDVAELGVLCLFSSSASPDPGVSPPKKGSLSFTATNLPTHPSPLGKNWEEGRIFQPVRRRALVSTSRLCRSFGFPQPGTKTFPCQVVFPAGRRSIWRKCFDLVGIFRVESEVQVPRPRSLVVPSPAFRCEIFWDLGKTNGFPGLCALQQAQRKLEFLGFLKEWLALALPRVAQRVCTNLTLISRGESNAAKTPTGFDIPIPCGTTMGSGTARHLKPHPQALLSPSSGPASES